MNSFASSDRRMAPRTLASQFERELVVEQLQAHAVSGRLDFDQLAVRTRSAWAARTQGELQALLADLPGAQVQSAPAMSAMPALEQAAPSGIPWRHPTLIPWMVAVLGSVSRRGVWRLKPQTGSLAVLGSCDLDLSQVQVDADDPHITAIALLGSVTIIVPEGVQVEVNGIPLLGSVDCRVHDAPPNAQTPFLRLQVTGIACMGSVTVKSKGNLSRLIDTARGRLL